MCLDNGLHGSIMDSMVFMRDKMSCFPISPEGRGTGKATNSEIIRMIRSGSIEINGEQPMEFKAPMPCPVTSLVFFPKGKRRTTIL